MFYSEINLMKNLSSRSIRKQCKKRQLNFNEKETPMIKRLKISYEKPNLMNFQYLPNEIYQEIFDYLQPMNLIQSFYGLNYRLNRLIENIPMKLNFSIFNKIEYKRVLKQIVPKIIQQIVAIDLGQSSYHSSEFLIDLFIQSFNWTQFSNLRYLSLTSPSIQQLESLFLVIPNMLSLYSLRLLEQDHYGSQNETICKLILSNNDYYSISKPTNNNHLKHIFIETSPPFRILNLLQKYFINKKIFVNYLQINIRCALFFYPDSLKHINYDELSRLILNMNYLKIDVMCGTFTPMFDLIRYFPQIQYLSVRTISQAYANGFQWADLLTQMPNINKLDLKIQFNLEKFDQELETFQTKFWSDRQWFVQSQKNYLNPTQCQFICRSIKVR